MQLMDAATVRRHTCNIIRELRTGVKHEFSRRYRRQNNRRAGCINSLYEPTHTVETAADLPCHPARRGRAVGADHKQQHGSIRRPAPAAAVAAGLGVSGRLDDPVRSDGACQLPVPQGRRFHPALCRAAAAQLCVADPVLYGGGAAAGPYRAAAALGADALASASLL